MASRRPFHETIIDAIRRIDVRDKARACVVSAELARLIVETRVMANHDEIAQIWIEKCKEIGWSSNLGVVVALVEQKREVQEELSRRAAKRLLTDSERLADLQERLESPHEDWDPKKD